MKNILITISIFSIVVITGCSSGDSGPSFEEQLAIDEEIIENYLVENSIDANKDESGIRFVISEEGPGQIPEIGDVIAVKFSGYKLDGSLVGRDTIGLTLTLQSPILAAWQIMVPEIGEGGKITIYSPSGYLFGPAGSGSTIPPNTNLIYEIELLAVIDDTEEQLEVDGAIIDEFLSEEEIEAEIHTSGIRFVTLTEGTGSSPTSSDAVLVKYNGEFLSGEVFDSNTFGVEFNLQNLIQAWKIMIPEMKEGGKIQIYAPSQYCYGTSGTPTIAPNTILTFEIELIEVR